MIVEKGLLFSHVLAGAASLLCGIGAIALGRKGGKTHRLCGTAYFWSMAWVFVSALAIVLFYRFNLFLLFISIFSFYMAYSGFRVLKRKKAGSHSAMDWVGALSAIAITIVVLVLAVRNMWLQKTTLSEILSLFFGFFSIQAALADIRTFRPVRPLAAKWWLSHHIQAMVGSFIAAVTAFLVQNGSKLTGMSENQWVFWTAPTLLGILYINYSVRKFVGQG